MTNGSPARRKVSPSTTTPTTPTATGSTQAGGSKPVSKRRGPKVTVMVGACLVLAGAAWGLGHGTAYTKSERLGVVGDGIASLYYCASWVRWSVLYPTYSE
jgi:hypothetical protein